MNGLFEGELDSVCGLAPKVEVVVACYRIIFVGLDIQFRAAGRLVVYDLPAYGYYGFVGIFFKRVVFDEVFSTIDM